MVTEYRFDKWRFNPDTGDIESEGDCRRLEPQVSKLLEYFINHQGEVLSRQQLVEQVWDNRVVTDDAVSRCISIIRQTLSPDDRSAYIETVQRRGYLARFPIVPGASTDKLATQSAGYPATPAEPSNSIAVLPFDNLSAAEEDAYFAAAIHDEVLTQLAKLESLRVISRTSVMKYRSLSLNLRDIAKELNVASILEGAVQKLGDRVRINVQLIAVFQGSCRTDLRGDL